jgi:hypothetical protein
MGLTLAAPIPATTLANARLAGPGYCGQQHPENSE